MPNILYLIYKEGLETYNDLIKIFILHLCTSIRQYRKRIIGLYMTTYTTN